MRFRSFMLLGVMVAAGMTAAAQGNATASTTEAGSTASSAIPSGSAPKFQERNPRYRLRKGDTFEVDFAMTPEFNQTVAVQPDGYISLKGAGSVFAEGQNVPELTETVKAAYAKVLHDPVIVIALKDFEKPYFIAAGEVGKPGKYDLRGDLTVTEAVAIAGGFDDKSKHSQVVLFHPMPGGGFQAKLIDVKKLLASHDLSEDVQLQPGDMLYVPQNALSKIRPFLPTSSVSAFLGHGVL